MKIDTHQHYWRYQAAEFPWINKGMPALQRDCMPDDCANDLRIAAVDAVVAVQARTMVDETDFLLNLATQYPQVVGVIGWADLASAELPHKLAQWRMHPAFKGLRHILQDEPDVGAWVNAPANNQGVRALQEHELVYEVLVFEHQLPGVISFCGRHDQHWLVLDHVGKPALRDWHPGTGRAAIWREHLRELAAMPHVMCKLSGLVTEALGPDAVALPTRAVNLIRACFDDALSLFGPDRIMYGSDWPVCQLTAPYHKVYDMAETWASATLSSAQQTAFWSGNAVRCYKLTSPSLLT